ncbi:nudix hydrolase 16, mitochondrial isoform X2 [Hevea brasiliensis]|uniref:nudix hydrolase 16, mitochondrial isoform X2 n=1 Tax=Hevea brasiliensis TaxID=3981 RepID=UPI0025F3C23E|nr:nudix hydrolase 16, mitochondrial isoform X2 [Hevea brasiliensis]
MHKHFVRFAVEAGPNQWAPPFGMGKRIHSLVCAAALVACSGRHQQRYEGGCRLVAGCIPFRYRNYYENGDTDAEKIVEVLMINSTSGPGLLFPKDLMGYYHFKSKTLQDECCPEGLCKASMFALFVKEELESWPEQITRTRSWLIISEAVENCRHKWMEDALKQFSVWLEVKM